jgi:hypothetical protein
MLDGSSGDGRALFGAICLDRMNQENRGAHQAKQGGCFEHGTNSLTGVYALIQGAEIEAEMGGGEGNGDSDEAPQQEHAKTGRIQLGPANGGLNECGHGDLPRDQRLRRISSRRALQYSR